MTKEGQEQRGLVLPFEPLSLTWQHIYYSVDVPPSSDVKGDQVTGYPRASCALMGKQAIHGCMHPGSGACWRVAWHG